MLFNIKKSLNVVELHPTVSYPTEWLLRWNDNERVILDTASVVKNKNQGLLTFLLQYVMLYIVSSLKLVRISER